MLRMTLIVCGMCFAMSHGYAQDEVTAPEGEEERGPNLIRP